MKMKLVLLLLLILAVSLTNLYVLVQHVDLNVGHTSSQAFDSGELDCLRLGNCSSEQQQVLYETMNGIIIITDGNPHPASLNNKYTEN